MSYYSDKLSEGEEYQDFLVDQLAIKKGLIVQVYGSKKYQYSKGESRQGIEIKYDNLLKKTGNLFIETHETNLKNIDLGLKPSGILRSDHWLYIIGDYSACFCFGSVTLQAIYNTSVYDEEMAKHYGFVRKVNGTSEGHITSSGFLINPQVAMDRQCCLFSLTF